MDKKTIVKKQDIVEGLRKLSVSKGDVILVHSSLKSFGYVESGAETVIDALLEAVGVDGTVIVPTITGLKKHSAANPPTFDVRNTACWTGKIPETFRKRKEAVRSLHPTHSVAAIGKYAEYVTKDHINSLTPCDKNSPYMKLVELNGKVVFIGVTLKSCTLLHAVEEAANCDYHLQPELANCRIIDSNGRMFEKGYYLHKWGTARDFEKLEPIFIEANIMKLGKIGNADVRVLKSAEAFKLTREFVKQDKRFLCKKE